MRSLPAEISEVFQGLLRPNEEILWIDRPMAGRAASAQESRLWLSIAWLAANMIPFSKAVRLYRSMHLPLAFKLFYAVIGLLWFLVAAGGMLPWCWEYVKARCCYYALTNRRALILHRRKQQWQVRALVPAQMNHLNLKRRPDGSGDVLFTTDVYEVPCSDGSGTLGASRETRTRKVGFFGLRDLDTPAALIREHLLGSAPGSSSPAE